MNKMGLFKAHKSILFTAIMCMVSSLLFAQDYSDYLLKARQRLAEGKCEKAQENYSVYKELTGLTDYELEKQINDCFNEGKSSWREKEELSEILIKTTSKQFSFMRRNDYPSRTEIYNRVLSDVKKDYPNKMIGIQEDKSIKKGVKVTTYYIYREGIGATDVYRDYFYDIDIAILEPNIRYYLNEAIRNAKDGSRIALNQVFAFGKADEGLESQLMSILFDEGFKVVKTISDADYYINVKMEYNLLQIRMANAGTGENEGVSSVKYDGFIDEIKRGKGGVCTSVEKSSTFTVTH